MSSSNQVSIDLSGIPLTNIHTLNDPTSHCCCHPIRIDSTPRPIWIDDIENVRDIYELYSTATGAFLIQLFESPRIFCCVPLCSNPRFDLNPVIEDLSLFVFPPSLSPKQNPISLYRCPFVDPSLSILRMQSMFLS